MRRENTCTSDDAVSPVVGVLLMLVVTIIIAAVVSGFAGGLAGSEQSAPSAAIDVKADSSTGKVVIQHLSGEPLYTKDLEIVTYYSTPSGNEYQRTTNKNSAVTEVAPANAQYSIPASYSRVPYLNDMSRTGGRAETSSWFGNYTFSNGDVMSTGTRAGTAGLLGFSGDNFTSGGIIDFKIKHIPSGKLIFDKEVAVI